MRYVVIMAGGSGTRLWPLSRKGMPKQLLPLIDGVSLLRVAFERAVTLVPIERVWVVTGAGHVAEVAKQLPELPAGNILGEPTGRDSLNAVAWAAAVLHARDPEAVIAQLTADHLIEPAETFRQSVSTAFALAEADSSVLVTLGVVPTSPHTGYGYLHRGEPIEGFAGAHEVVAFTEKPVREVAEAYLVSGEYWWNAGMFVWQARTLLEQLRLLLPQTYTTALELAAQPERLDELFPRLFKTSVDYAVMEPVSMGQGSARVVSVALPVEWRDVGGYPSLADVLRVGGSLNSVSGQVVMMESSGNVVINQDPDSVVAVLGVDDLVIVRTDEVTMVVPLAEAEKVKVLAAQVVADVGERFS